jgi:hypothetical protein
MKAFYSFYIDIICTLFFGLKKTIQINYVNGIAVSLEYKFTDGSIHITKQNTKGFVDSVIAKNTVRFTK